MADTVCWQERTLVENDRERSHKRAASSSQLRTYFMPWRNRHPDQESIRSGIDLGLRRASEDQTDLGSGRGSDTGSRQESAKDLGLNQRNFVGIAAKLRICISSSMRSRREVIGKLLCRMD